MSNGASMVPHPPGNPSPDWEEVRQEDQEHVMHAVPVDVRGIVPTRELPAKRSDMRGMQVGSLTDIPQPNELIPADPRLKAVWITSPFANLVVGTLEQVMKQPSPDGFPVPQNFPMRWEGFDRPVYGVTTTNGAYQVGLRYEYWAD